MTQIITFLDALGANAGDSSILDVIARAGPATKVYEQDRDGATWKYTVFGPNGVDLQFEDDVLVAALMCLRPGEE